MTIQGSSIENIRYIYPAFPYFSVFFVLAVQALLPQDRKGRRILCLLAVLLPILSIEVYGIDWLYSDFDQVTAGSEKLRGADCIVLFRDDTWVNVLQAIDVYRNMDEVRCVYVSEMDRMEQAIDERATDDPLCIAFYSDENYSPEEREAFLNGILARTPYQQYTMLYDYYTVIYMLS